MPWNLIDILRGSNGLNGTPGTPGSSGTAATVAVGTTTTGSAGSSASVSNSGTSSAAVLDFTIPRGATGATGPSGSSAATTEIVLNSSTTFVTGTASAGQYQLTSSMFPLTVRVAAFAPVFMSFVGGNFSAFHGKRITFIHEGFPFDYSPFDIEVRGVYTDLSATPNIASYVMNRYGDSVTVEFDNSGAGNTRLVAEVDLPVPGANPKGSELEERRASISGTVTLSTPATTLIRTVDQPVDCSAAAANITVNPASFYSSSTKQSCVIYIYPTSVSGGNLTLTPFAGSTINGSATPRVISSAYDVRRLFMRSATEIIIQ